MRANRHVESSFPLASRNNNVGTVYHTTPRSELPPFLGHEKWEAVKVLSSCMNSWDVGMNDAVPLLNGIPFRVRYLR